LSTEGLGVIAGLLLIGCLLVFETGSRGLSVVFLLLGVGSGAWAWTRRERRRRRPPAPTNPNVVPPPSDGVSQVENPALRLMKALQARAGDGSTGHTVRLDTLIETDSESRPVHLVITGDGPPREMWFGRGPEEPWPSELVVGRLPAPGQPSVTISSKAVSGLQARLLHQNSTFLIENLSKTNATRVGGRPLLDGERRPLADGDLIEMGPVTISYRIE
jgi:hypothetical protein